MNIKGNSKTLKPFKKGVDPRRNIKGQPPKLLSHLNAELIKEGYQRVTATQVSEAYELLFNLSQGRIKKIIDDVSQPFFLRKIATAMGTARGIEMIERMLDRAHGRAVQPNTHVVEQVPIIRVMAKKPIGKK